MDNLLKKETHPNEKIKTIVKEAMLQLQNESQNINKQITSLKQQDNSGVYYTPINTNVDSTFTFAIGTIFSILNILLHGFQAGIEFVKQDVETRQKQKQIGGATATVNVDPSNNQQDNTSDNISLLIDSLTKLINQAQGELTKLTKTHIDTGLGEKSPGIAGTAMSKAKDIGEAGLKTGIKFTGDVLVKLIDYIMTLTGEESILETPIDKLSPELNKKVLILAGILKAMSTNPATKQAIKEIAKAVAISMDEFINEIREPAVEIAGHAMDMLQSVASKFVSGITATGISVIQSFLAEVPFIGGILDLFISIGKGFNTLMKTYRIFVEKGSPLTLTAIQTGKNAMNKLAEGANRIKNTAKSSMKNIADSETSIPNTSTPIAPIAPVAPVTPVTPVAPVAPVAPVTPVTPVASQWVQKTGLNGNVFWKNEKTGKVSATQPDGWKPTSNVQNGGSINNAIMRGGTRLRKTMKRFHNTLPKLKYTCNNKHYKLNKSKKVWRNGKKRNKSKRR